jgi:atrial natriuretic peptide receptor A
VCEYVIAPVARYAGEWGIPVLTAGAQADAFFHKPLFPTLTRMMGSYRLVGQAVRHILHVFGWQVAGLLYHNHGVGSPLGNSMCHFTLLSIFTALNQTPAHRSFNEDTASPQEYRQLLQFVSRSARSKCRIRPSFLRTILFRPRRVTVDKISMLQFATNVHGIQTQTALTL